MLNYEELLERIQPVEKAIKDASGAAVRLQKTLQKDLETGNLAEAKKSLSSLAETVVQLKALTDQAGEMIDGFDTREYFAGGDFTRQLLDICREKGVDVRGEKGVYEMFPYKIRVLGDEERSGEVYMDRKRIPSVRPAYVAEAVRAGQAKLYSANFKELPFMTELADAYETTCLKSGARIGSTQTLSKIYRSMAPMARSRKEYDMQAFAFDLARLYEAGPDAWVAKDGCRYTFGTSRDGASGIRVLSASGVESFISTLRPLNERDA